MGRFNANVIYAVMNARFSFLLLFCWGVVIPIAAQSNKLIHELESKRGELQQQIANAEELLNSTKKNVSSQLNALEALSGQIEERKRYIKILNKDVALVERELLALERQLTHLQQELKGKKQRYEASVQYLYKHRTIEEKLMFIFSAQNLSQTYRRLRYVREYATFQRLQGEDILKKQKQIAQKKEERLQVRKAKEAMLWERETEQKKLEKQEKEQRALVVGLQRKQRSLQSEIKRQRREADQLNARIDRLIAEEIERARKQAEEEARRETVSQKKTSSKKAVPIDARPVDKFVLSKADLQLSSDFASNRGKLPVPITGAYLIASHYGQYAVKGLKNVRLDNKGIDIQGKPGARARAIFNGKVAAVFQLNGLFNILVRHGNYISVYCNLSETSVKQGDVVKTKQDLGRIFSDATDNQRTVLHFQLRREKEKLNPEPWLNH